MGSSGTGRITDYSGSQKPSTGTNGAGGGGGVPEDRCSRAFNVTLEDVEQSAYFVNHGTLPAVGTEMTIGLQKRVVATTTSGEVVGNLPTSFNYLFECMKDGWKYYGKVETARPAKPTATVVADFVAAAPK